MRNIRLVFSNVKTKRTSYVCNRKEAGDGDLERKSIHLPLFLSLYFLLGEASMTDISDPLQVNLQDDVPLQFPPSELKVGQAAGG